MFIYTKSINGGGGISEASIITPLGATSVTIPAGTTIMHYLAYDVSGRNILLGTTPGNNDVADLTTADYFAAQDGSDNYQAETTLYITGLSAAGRIILIIVNNQTSFVS